MKKLLIAALTLAIVSVLTYESKAQGQSAEEIESMMISSMVRYMEFQPITGTSVNVVVVNQPVIFKYVSKYFANRKIQGIPVVVIQGNGKTPTEGVNVLISKRGHVVQDNLLTVNIDNTDGIMNLILEDDKVKVKIRKTLATENKIKISSSLTSMITIID